MVCLFSGLTFIQTVSPTSTIIKKKSFFFPEQQKIFFFSRATESGLKACFSVRYI